MAEDKKEKPIEMEPGDDVAEAQRPLEEAVGGTSGASGNQAGDQKPVPLDRD